MNLKEEEIVLNSPDLALLFFFFWFDFGRLN